jgi:hypothetical protein
LEEHEADMAALRQQLSQLALRLETAPKPLDEGTMQAYVDKKFNKLHEKTNRAVTRIDKDVGGLRAHVGLASV